MAGESASTPKFDPITVTITETVRLTGKSRASIYEAIARGQLRAVKDGARTLVTFEVDQGASGFVADREDQGTEGHHHRLKWNGPRGAMPEARFCRQRSGSAAKQIPESRRNY